MISTRSSPGWPVIGVVAAGGALGAAARYGVVAAWPSTPGTLPWATIAINIGGCLAIGVFLARIGARPLLRPFVATGVLGGFTTFSAFAVQTLELSDRPLLAAAYLLLTVAGSLGGAWFGERLGRLRS